MTTQSFFAQPPVAMRAGVLAVAAAFPMSTLAATAAKVEFAVGDPVVVSASGQTRALTKGAVVESGDKILTNAGRLQLRFTDQAYVSLQPQSEFRIDDYRFNGKADGTEKGFFSLLKGGLRTITGLVGRTNKKNYQVQTTVATIGIRGTEYTIAYTGSITGSVGEGEVNVCNSVGCVPFGSGQSFHVSAGDKRPLLINQKTDLPPEQAPEPTPSFVSGDQTGSDGLPNIFIFTGTQTLSVASVEEGSSGSANSPVQVVFDGAGVVQKIGMNSLSQVRMGGNNAILAWGTGLVSPSGGELVDPITHFVAGLQTSAADFSALQAGNTTLTYTQFGGTAVTGFVGSTDRVSGAIPSMTLALRTGAGFAKADVTAEGAFSHAIAGGTETFTYAVKKTDIIINPATGVGSAFVFPFSNGGECTMAGSSCTATIALLFAGRNASNAGAVLNVNGSTPSDSAMIAGSAVFTATNPVK